MWASILIRWVRTFLCVIFVSWSVVGCSFHPKNHMGGDGEAIAGNQGPSGDGVLGTGNGWLYCSADYQGSGLSFSVVRRTSIDAILSYTETRKSVAISSVRVGPGYQIKSIETPGFSLLVNIAGADNLTDPHFVEGVATSQFGDLVFDSLPMRCWITPALE